MKYDILLSDGDNLEDGVILDHAEDDELLDEDGLIVSYH